jgi:integrase
LPRHRLPKYVHAFVDRHGKARYYVRRRGQRHVPLPGLPWSDEFMRAHAAALEGSTGARAPVGASRSPPGSVSAAIAGYYATTEFSNLAAATQHDRRDILERFRRANGQLRIAELARKHVDGFIAKKAATPGAARNLLSALRAVCKFAVTAGLRGDDPTVGVKRPKLKRDGGHYPWTEEDIAKFEARFPIGTRERLALALLLTGQRRADIVRMGAQHVRDGFITVRQSKTGKPVEVPLSISAGLAEILPRNNLTFLVTQYGKPYTPAGFTNWFKNAVRRAGLPATASVHGLRYATALRMAEAGCTAHEIMAITGHASLREAERYTRKANQKKLATSAAEKVRARTRNGKPSRKFSK